VEVLKFSQITWENSLKTLKMDEMTLWQVKKNLYRIRPRKENEKR